jgi:hypothetical protein
LFVLLLQNSLEVFVQIKKWGKKLKCFDFGKPLYEVNRNIA